MKIFVTVVLTDIVTNMLLSCKPKTSIGFSASDWVGNEKYFCFLFIASRPLLQSHAEFNRLV